MTINKKRRLTIFINPAIAKHIWTQVIVDRLTLTAFIERIFN